MTNKNSKALVKTKKAKEAQKKLMLAPSFLKVQQLLHILQKTPKQHIYTRPGKPSSMEWEYVTGTYVKKILNYVFGWLWDFEVVEHGEKGDLIWVLGKLTVKDKKGLTISKTQFGRADIKFQKGKPHKPEFMVDFGNDLKAATTDALKKCASEFGIASDIYGKNEFKEVKLEATKIGGQAVNKLFAGEKEKKMIERLCKELGADDPDKAYDLVKKLTGVDLILNNLTKDDSMKIIAALLQKQTAKKNGK